MRILLWLLPFFSSLSSSRFSQSGNVMMYILLGVIAISGLAYTFSKSMTSQGTRKAESNRQALSQVDSQTCTLWVNRGIDTLKQRGCSQDDISFELSSGHNSNPNAPVDESCHVFRENGAGMEPCGAYLDVTSCNLTTLALGEQCPSDDIIYAGDSGGNRIYTTAADQSAGLAWAQAHTVTGVTSLSDGAANTDTLVALTDAGDPYSAAELCRGLGPDWYLPSRDELAVVYANKAVIGGFNETGANPSGWYITSSEFSITDVWAIRFSDGFQGGGATKTIGYALRCVRQD